MNQPTLKNIYINAFKDVYGALPICIPVNEKELITELENITNIRDANLCNSQYH